MRKFFGAVFVAWLSCFLGACQREETDPDKMARRELSRFNGRLDSQFSAIVCGYPAPDWSEFDFNFNITEALSVEQMRRFIVDSVLAIEAEINTNEAIGLVVKDKPIGAANIRIHVWSYKVLEDRLSDYVAYALMLKDRVDYCRVDKPGEEPGLYLIRSESWETALQQVQQDADAA